MSETTSSSRAPEWITRLELPEIVETRSTQAWLVHLKQPEPVVASAADVLSPDETARAARFLVEPARRTFVLSRGALRTVLGRSVDIRPKEIRFEYGPRGKPSLAGGPGNGRLRFNVAHSGDLALIALAEGREVGVDLELARDQEDLDEIAGRFFATAEQELLRRTTPKERLRTFYRIWTCKEAVLKAGGMGITSGLQLPDVSACVETGSNGTVISHQGAHWLVCPLPLDAGYEAALALEKETGKTA
jgi:4'-phosphopantetheinyl transferase